MGPAQAEIMITTTDEDGEQYTYVSRELTVLSTAEAAQLARRLEAVINRFLVGKET